MFFSFLFKNYLASVSRQFLDFLSICKRYFLAPVSMRVMLGFVFRFEVPPYLGTTCRGHLSHVPRPITDKAWRTSRPPRSRSCKGLIRHSGRSIIAYTLCRVEFHPRSAVIYGFATACREWWRLSVLFRVSQTHFETHRLSTETSSRTSCAVRLRRNCRTISINSTWRAGDCQGCSS